MPRAQRPLPNPDRFHLCRSTHCLLAPKLPIMDSFFTLLFFGPSTRVPEANIEDIELQDEDSPGGGPPGTCVVA
jgi:hypothetical protein